MNLSIAGTASSSCPTLGLGALATVVFFAGGAGPIINVIPRFLLGGLCVFAGVGFLVEACIGTDRTIGSGSKPRGPAGRARICLFIASRPA